VHAWSQKKIDQEFKRVERAARQRLLIQDVLIVSSYALKNVVGFSGWMM
jgi:hypothetical protein